ncbi:unnamed protein product, partial [Ectocarpus sp. 8 AP-2014]
SPLPVVPSKPLAAAPASPLPTAAAVAAATSIKRFFFLACFLRSRLAFLPSTAVVPGAALLSSPPTAMVLPASPSPSCMLCLARQRRPPTPSSKWTWLPSACLPSKPVDMVPVSLGRCSESAAQAVGFGSEFRFFSALDDDFVVRKNPSSASISD